MARISILVLGLCVVVATAAADPKADKQRAKQLYETGLQHYNIAEYESAITAWKEAYLLSKAPLLLFNLGQAYRLSGDCAKAMTFYESYVREEPDPKNREELEGARALCKATDKPTTDKPTIDKPTIDKPTIDKPTIDKPTIDKPTTEKPTIDKPTIDKPARLVPDDRGRSKRLAGLIAVGFGGLLGGTAIVFAVDSRSQNDKLDGFSGEWGEAQRRIETRGERDEKLAWVCGGVGVASLVAGGVLYFLGRGANETAVTVVPTPRGASINVRLSF